MLTCTREGKKRVKSAVFDVIEGYCLFCFSLFVRSKLPGLITGYSYI